MLTHDALHPGEPLYLREALAAHGVEADHVKVWQTVGKLRRRHGLVKERGAAGAGVPGRGADAEVRDSLRQGGGLRAAFRFSHEVGSDLVRTPSSIGNESDPCRDQQDHDAVESV